VTDLRRAPYYLGPVATRRDHAKPVRFAGRFQDPEWQERVHKWVEESTRAQGLPFHVTDPVVLRYIAGILASAQKEREENERPLA
jgi:hypothetical protein